MRVLIEPSSTPTGYGICLLETLPAKLGALSKCCGRVLLLNRVDKHTYCFGCKTEYSWEKLRFVPTRSAGAGGWCCGAFSWVVGRRMDRPQRR